MGINVLLLYRNLDDTSPYVDALRLVGLIPVLAEANADAALAHKDGVLLMGGSDVNPMLYKQAPHEHTEPPDDERDTAESSMLQSALADDLPVLAICRGVQMLNVHLGGTLIQHLPGTHRHRVRTPDRSLPAHEICVEPGTMLESITEARRFRVNSRHHQAIDDLGEGLIVNARDADDGIVEGVEMPGRRYVLGVQWHPENQAGNDPIQRKLFASFATAIRNR